MSKPYVLWLTGLSGAGKTTLAQNFIAAVKPVAFLHFDGDEFRKEVSSDLGFSDRDRSENIRRLIGVCNLVTKQGFNVITSFITPLQIQRNLAREKLEPVATFHEVFVQASLATCRERDPKGLYKKNIKNFTGIDSTYEQPDKADLVLNTESESLQQCLEKMLKLVS